MNQRLAVWRTAVVVEPSHMVDTTPPDGTTFLTPTKLRAVPLCAPPRRGTTSPAPNTQRIRLRECWFACGVRCGAENRSTFVATQNKSARRAAPHESGDIRPRGNENPFCTRRECSPAASTHAVRATPHFITREKKGRGDAERILTRRRMYRSAAASSVAQLGDRSVSISPQSPR